MATTAAGFLAALVCAGPVAAAAPVPRGAPAVAATVEPAHVSTAGPVPASVALPVASTRPVADRVAAPVPAASKPAVPRTSAPPSADELMVREAIGARMTAMGRCYERAQLRNPALRGKLVVSIAVAADGSVAGTRIVRDGVGDDGLARCATDRIALWRLPRPEKGALKVRIPISFRP
jgi:TonB family protein